MYVQWRLNQQRAIKCPCGGNYTIAHKAKHERTIKHQDMLLNIGQIKQIVYPDLIPCACGSYIKHSNNIRQHMRTSIHIKNMNLIYKDNE